MMTRGQKITLFSLVAVFLILIVGITYFLSSGKVKVEWAGDRENVSEPSKEIRKKQSEEAAQETQKLIDEIKELSEKASEEEKDDQELVKTITINKMGEDGTTTEEKAVVVAPGTGPISENTGDVLRTDGQGKADNTVEPGSENSPVVSYAIEDTKKLPESTIKLEVDYKSIEPKEFRVKAGQAVSLSATIVGDRSHLLLFEDGSLNAVRLSLIGGQSKAITFNAPLEPGEYIFYSERYKDIGAFTKMIVE